MQKITRVASSPNNSASVQILDNELPRVSIGSIISESSETGMIFFEISWSPSLPTGTTILLHSQLDGDFFEAGEYNGDFTVTTDPWSVITLMVRLANDSIPESDGSITFSIRDSEEYNVNPRFSSKTVRVLDDDSPRLSISAGSEAFVEGGEGDIIISAENPVPSDLLVNLNLNIEGDYEFNDHPSSVTISAGETSASLTLEIEDDDQLDPDGILMASIVPNANYNLANNNSSVSMNLLDNEQLRVSITSATDAIFEGELLEFRLSTNQIPTKDLAIGLDSTVEGDFLVSEIPESIIIYAGRSEAHFALQLKMMLITKVMVSSI